MPARVRACACVQRAGDEYQHDETEAGGAGDPASAEDPVQHEEEGINQRWKRVSSLALLEGGAPGGAVLSAVVMIDSRKSVVLSRSGRLQPTRAALAGDRKGSQTALPLEPLALVQLWRNGEGVETFCRRDYLSH